jgi:serine/threonine protein phosphatase 1
MRTLVVGDIHGGLRALQQVLGQASPEAGDTIVFLGDYVDGWSDASQTVDFLIGLRETHHCIFIRGNHDELCLKWLTLGRENPLWLQAGGEATQKSYAGIGLATRKEHIRFLESLADYHIDQAGRLYVHAGFTNPRGVDHEYATANFYWDRTLWEMALSLNPELTPADPFYPARFKLYNEIYIGHTALTKFGLTRPTQAANVWNVDTGAAHKGPLSILEAQGKQVWQSKPVYQVYPGESGRN